jgi:plastocyanin
VTKNLLFLAPLFATAAFAAGCGGGSDSGDERASQPAAAQTAETVATTAPAENELPTADTEVEAAPEPPAEVKMAGSTFAPADVQLTVGDTITFVNDDQIAHTATADDGAFDSGTMEPGATFDFTAEKAGTISYVCEFHPGMTGTITVT